MATTENVWKGVGKISPLETMGALSGPPNSGMREENFHPEKRPGRFLGVLGYLFNQEKKEPEDTLEHYLELSQKNPKNATFHLKLAEMYQRKGEEEKAIAEYLQAAEIFTQNQIFPQAMTIYKQVLLLNPQLVQVNQKMAEIYWKTGFLADADSQYRMVIKHYERWGKREKIPELMKMLKELEAQRSSQEKRREASSETLKIPQARPETLSLSASRVVSRGEASGENGGREEKEEAPGDFFDLRAELAAGGPMEWKDNKEITTDRLFGFEEIFKELQEAVIPSEAYPDFNYHMGMACREMGFNDEAIEQLQIAFDNGQNPVQSARLLSKCLREKGWFHEAQKYFEKAMQLEGETRKRPSGFKSELVLVHG